MDKINRSLRKIQGPDIKKMEEVREIWDRMAKPKGSLGKLEDLVVKISGMTSKTYNTIDKKALVVMAADNGVVEEGVSSCPENFTLGLAKATIEGITGISALARFTGSKVFLVDLGLGGDYPKDLGIINKNLMRSTRNFTKEEAMPRDLGLRAIEIGIEIGDLIYRDFDIIGTGELGIGNTTTASGVFAGLSGLDPRLVTGLGAGITKDQYEKKIQTIERGLDLHKPDKNDPIGVLTKLGGLDMAGLVGLYISAGKNRKPIVVDGFISGVAALVATRLNPLLINYILPSHLSSEKGSRLLMESLGLSPMLNMDMRLGEGTGCPLAFQIIEAGLYSFREMGTYEEGNMRGEGLVNIRGIKND